MKYVLEVKVCLFVAYLKQKYKILKVRARLKYKIRIIPLQQVEDYQTSEAKYLLYNFFWEKFYLIPQSSQC